MSLYEDIPSEPEPLNCGDTDIEVELDELYGNIPSEVHDSSVQNEGPPSSTFNELDFEIIDSICEEGSQLEHIGSSSNDSGEIYKGAMFESKKDLQHVIKRYCLAHHYQIVVVESNQDNWYVKCKKWKDGCTWRLRACRKKIHGLFEITKIEEPHSCIYPQLTQDHSQLDSNLIANEIQSIIRRDPGISIATLQQIVSTQFEYNVNYKRVWHAKRKALIKVFGDWKQSYAELPYWLNAVAHYNEGTHILWDIIPSNVPGNSFFNRVFWSFGPAIEGFKYCRPVIQIDGTHLYGKYKGKLLIATSIDANGHIFPLAFAIVEEENTSS